MNQSVGGILYCLDQDPMRIGVQKQTDVVNPGPSRLLVFLDEHPDGIEFVSFWVDKAQGAGAKLLSVPSSLHDGAGSVSFADGHVELHRWQDVRTKAEVKYNHYLAIGLDTPNNPDVKWLQERAIPVN